MRNSGNASRPRCSNFRASFALRVGAFPFSHNFRPSANPATPRAAPRSTLLALHRTANLRQDSVGEEMLINLLLRNLLHYNQYDQAEKLRAKLTWPEKYSNQQYCRYLYYLGRIRCIELEYSAAKDCLAQASRKAPKAATGFRITLYKWLVLVRLLLGEIPERTIFVQAGLEAPLKPYFDLTDAVRRGDLHAFHAAAEKHAATFAADKTANLIVRLRRNVIRTGLRRLSLAYSRISLADVAEKLGLSSSEDAECIVSKAIRDGSIEAVLDHTNGWMQSHEVADVYNSTVPQQEFHSRITFCLDLHNEAVKAMRFPGDGQKKSLETPEARRERCVSFEGRAGLLSCGCLSGICFEICARRRRPDGGVSNLAVALRSRCPRRLAQEAELAHALAEEEEDGF